MVGRTRVLLAVYGLYYRGWLHCSCILIFWPYQYWVHEQLGGRIGWVPVAGLLAITVEGRNVVDCAICWQSIQYWVDFCRRAEPPVKKWVDY